MMKNLPLMMKRPMMPIDFAADDDGDEDDDDNNLDNVR